jgi:hypothetical protein
VEVLGASVDAAKIRARRGRLASEKDPDGRLQVRAYDDSSETEPRPNGESAAILSVRDETCRLLGERKVPWWRR